AWRVLADQLTLTGDLGAADAAYAQHIRASVHDPVLRQAAIALCDERLAHAERLLRGHLQVSPTDVAAIRMLGELGTRLGRYSEAEALLERCLELAPSFTGARHNYAVVLYRRQKAAKALVQIDRLLAEDPRDPSYRTLKAAVLALLGDFGAATELYEEILAERAAQPKIWLSYGHALRAGGQAEDAVAAYKRAIADAPLMGEAYWSLANLKTHRFSAADEADIRRFLADARLGPDDRLHLAFTLGKILEDRGDWAEAFQNYVAGAAIHRNLYPFDIAAMRSQTRGSKALFTREFLAERAAGGALSAEPIFIIGLPRSGSTLIEQILASHSMVEGTFELPDIISAARELGGEGIDDPLEAVGRFLGAVAALSPDRRQRLGEKYLADTAVHRKLGRPRFIDKMPNNSRYVGLIHLILPNARIIDARRHPMAACFSAFKQHFARGYRFSYDLTDLGLYYRDYLGLMDHFDQVLPGRVHRVIYEDMVADTEGQVRRLLDYLGLPFEEACLRFHETDRAVRTASSEQVRRPIFREGLDQWRRFEPWLGPLKAALGPARDDWRK
ncbi:MAG: sulfotransferase, partial [Pseudomonadota bacterium]|nr:sulfotransferase [Pseudomonadota bacterium]